MAFFPLVLDTSNGNQIVEIPASSELSLSEVQLTGLNNLSISGAYSSVSLTTTEDINIGGDAFISGGANISANLSAATLNVTSDSTLVNTTVNGTLTVDSKNVADYLIQSDWSVNNPSDPAFILNKPDLGEGVTVINDLTDVQADPSAPAFYDTNRVMLAWDSVGSAWIAMNQPPAGVDLTAFSAGAPTAPPGTNFNGNISYNNSTGVFTFEQPDIPRSLTDLGVTNNVTTDNFAETALPLRFFRSDAITNTDGLIGISVAEDDVNGDIVTLTINNPGWISGESDTLQTVTDRGAVTTQDITTGAINASSIDAQATELAPNNIGFSSGSSLSLTGELSVTGNSTFGASIDILSAVGEIQATTLTTSDRLNSDLINSSTELLLRGTKVTVDGNHFKITPNVTLPSSPTVGDITHNGDSAAIYVTDKDSGGNPGWVWLGGPFAPEGIILPNKTNTERNAMTPVLGMMILNIDTATVQVYNGSTWINVGP